MVLIQMLFQRYYLILVLTLLQTEKKIIDTINSLKNQKTIIIVSHRMSTLNICDEIFELKDRKLKKFIK